MILRLLRSRNTNNVRVHKLVTVFTLHFSISHDSLLGEGIISTHFFGQENPSFFDHFKRRSDNTEHTFGNNKDLPPNFGGQNDLAQDGQWHWLF
jgi:hypothetical protein